MKGGGFLDKVFRDKWMLSVKVFLYAVVPGLIAQYVVRSYGLNILDMNIIIASLLTGAVFLIGFMLSGILEDFKESERILGRIANNILAIQDHNRIERVAGNRKALRKHLLTLTKSIKLWLLDKEKLDTVLKMINGISTHVGKFKLGADYGSRVEGEQRDLRQSIMRVHVIKDTTFIKAGYTIMEVISAAVIVLIVFSSTDTYILGATTYAASSFILVYMILLIKDMDDPFQYNGEGVAEASLMSLDKAISLLEKEKM